MGTMRASLHNQVVRRNSHFTALQVVCCDRGQLFPMLQGPASEVSKVHDACKDMMPTLSHTAHLSQKQTCELVHVSMP